MYKGSKTPHKPERCGKCQRGIRVSDGAYICSFYGENMATNKRGESWRNWVCPRHVPTKKGV